MKIDNQNTISGVNLYQNDQLAKKTENSQQSVKTQDRQLDRVELTTRKGEMEKLDKAVNDLPDVRAEKVAALKQQIDAGTYRVDSTKVAAKMLESWNGTTDTGGSR
jgi:negative regulator of flagellin synthesis FlgM